MFARAATESAKTKTVSKTPSRKEWTRVADQERRPERSAAEFEQSRAGVGLQWGFGGIPLFPPGGQPSLPSVRLQRKLAIGSVDDPLEREADRVADQVIRMPDSALSVSNAPPQVSRKCAECEEEEKSKTVQRKAAGVAPTPSVVEALPIVHDALREPGRPLDTEIRAFMAERFGHDFRPVRVHTDAKAARSANAVAASAYTIREHLVFGAGSYQPATEGGRHLIAHELAHFLQQSDKAIPAQLADKSADAFPPRSIPTARIIQRRRLPPGAKLATELPAAGAGFGQAREGLARAISRAWGELNPAQQAAVRTATSGLGIAWTTEPQLLTALDSATRSQLLSFATAIRNAAPSAELGDPLLIDTGARPGTGDAANISTLVTNASNVFTAIASGARDVDLKQVFGAANVATAKTKYANAKSRMNFLKSHDKIVTDRSGYAAEVGLGGLSNSAQISVEPSTIDNPTDNESVVTLIHESMHAGNNDVQDFGYIDQPSFKELPASVKVTNAAHFEVVPRRILGAGQSFAGQTFIPAGTAVGGVTAPPLTPRQQAIRGASETFRSAWTVGLNLHTLFVRLFRTPTEWNTLDLSTQFGGAAAGARFSSTLPFWSKVEMLTIHERAGRINPAGTPDARPVTQIDIALSEGVVRKLSQGMTAVPQTEADAASFETAHGSAAELTAAAANVNAERDLLIKLVIQTNLGSITGDAIRDPRVVKRMAAAGSTPDFTDMLAIRPASAFP